MAKLSIFFVSLLLALFGSSHSASFQCEYKTVFMVIIGETYLCEVKNSINITSLDAAQVDSISTRPPTGFNKDNIEVFSVITKGQIHFFPRGLNKLFKNLKSIQLHDIGLKEIHQSDLKDFPELIQLSLSANNLEIIEENLFEFNPNLGYIYLSNNKISYIHPNVFDKLTKLSTLYLYDNICINLNVARNSSEVQNLIKTTKSQCTNMDYSKLEQKFNNLEIESKNLNSANFKNKLEILENEIKNFNFTNTFFRRLKDLKAIQAVKKTQKTTTTYKTTTTGTATTIEATKKPEVSSSETCSALESKIDEIAANLNICVVQAVNATNSNKVDNDHQQNEQCAAIKEDLRNQIEAIGRIDNRTETFNEAMDTRMEILEENVENFKMSALREIQNIKNAVKDAHHGLMMSMNFKADKIERKIEEQNRKFEKNFAIILKALKIDD